MVEVFQNGGEGPAAAGPGLGRIVDRCHGLLAEVLGPGDLAVDLTAGNGKDTLFLHRAVGPGGRVVAFDIQTEAIDRTAERLSGAGARVVRHGAGAALPPEPGVYLVHGDHARLGAALAGAWVRAAVANLGYRPGGDPAVTTGPDTTVAALLAAMEHLTPGGRLVSVCYVGHPGGRDEAAAVDRLVSGLEPALWETLRLTAPNRPGAPVLVAAQRRDGG